MGGYKAAWMYNFDQVPFSVDRLFKKQNCSKGAKYNKLWRVAATMDLEKNFCTIMPIITADAFASRNRPTPLIVIFKGKGQISQKRMSELNEVRSVEL